MTTSNFARMAHGLRFIYANAPIFGNTKIDQKMTFFFENSKKCQKHFVIVFFLLKSYSYI